MKNTKVLQILFYLLWAPVLAPGQKFSHQVYILSDHFLRESCEVSAPCDCCASDLIFLSRKKFALVDRCLYHDTYLRGNYSATKNILTLDFKPVVIDHTYDENSKKEGVEKKEMKIPPLMLQIHPCGTDKTILVHPTIREYKYGSMQTNRKDSEIIRALKKSKAWKTK